MAEAEFEMIDQTIEGGVVVPTLKGTIYTRDYDLVVEVTPDHDDPGFFRKEDANQKTPSHNIKVLSRTGRMIAAGRAWTQDKGKGPFLGMGMTDPKLNFSLWQDNETEVWRATGGAFS